MQHHYDFDNENKPARKEKDRGGMTYAEFMDRFFIPGFVGMMLAILLEKFFLAFAEAFNSGKSYMSLLNFALNSLSQDLNLFFSGQFGQTNIWVLALSGLAGGIFLKLVFGQEKIR